MGEVICDCGAWAGGVICRMRERCIIGISRWAGRKGIDLE